MRLANESRFARGAALLLGVWCAACQDGGGDPTALLAGEDVHPAVALAAELPSLPGLAAEGAMEPETAAAIDLWIGSWSAPESEGEEQRGRAYAQAGGRLAARLGPARVEDALAHVESALAGADRLGPATLPEAIALRLRAAHEEALAARRALDAGALEAAVLATLHSADLLRGIGPEGVARTLIRRAEGGLDWSSGPADPVDRARAERLVAGAWEAVEQGGYGLAIQRAWYAIQLLGVALQ